MGTELAALAEVDPVELMLRQREIDEDCRQMNQLAPDSCTWSFNTVDALLWGALLIFAVLLWWRGRGRKR